MTEQYIGWALIVGGVLGGALVWFILGRLPRRTEDVGTAERREEAMWIADVIESRGGVAPPALVDEVLELHARYLEGPPLEVRPEPAWRPPERHRPPIRGVDERLAPPIGDVGEGSPAGATDPRHRPAEIADDDRAVPIATAAADDDGMGGRDGRRGAQADLRRSELPDEDRSTV